jgi:ABC-type phosphate/phosphonate transport system substrate-binding protein
MAFDGNSCERGLGRLVCWWIGAAAVVALCAMTAEGRAAKIDVLRIGTSQALEPQGGDDKSALETLRSFIKDETGLDNEIVRQKSWKELADKMSSGQLQVGVFQGFEFAWAKQNYPDLKPLAVSVNLYVYPEVYVVTGRDSPANDFKSLQGKALSEVKNAPGYVGFYVERQCRAASKTPDKFFSKSVPHENFEDAIDDVVDGQADAVAADRASLETYKRRKPGRFAKLKMIAQSKPFPPATVAIYGSILDEETIRQFRSGLLNASNKEKGQTMLNLFRLTGFKAPPDDFDKVLAATRAAYPTGNGDKGK